MFVHCICTEDASLTAVSHHPIEIQQSLWIAKQWGSSELGRNHDVSMVQAVAVALYNPEGFRTFGQARLDVGRVLPERMSDASYRELLVSGLLTVSC